jgi:hypothetical protein
MRIIWLVGLILIALGVTGCTKLKYKPYVPEEYSGESGTDPNSPGIYTGKSGEYVIYGK